MFNETLTSYQHRINQVLKTQIERQTRSPNSLTDAMSYCTLNAGKRIRAALLYRVGELMDGDPVILDLAAAAIEFIHAYSLIHDDLPAMDDSPLRRGKPSCHIQFGEATAILAGDCLQTLAFSCLSRITNPFMSQHMTQLLSEAIGPCGMGGGQTLDIEANGKGITEQQLKLIYEMKTSELIVCAVKMSLVAGNRPLTQHRELIEFAEQIGLGFQIRDDIIDIEMQTDDLGKPQGLDQKRIQPTYPSVLGLKEAKKRRHQCHQAALAALDRAEIGDPWLGEFVGFCLGTQVVATLSL